MPGGVIQARCAATSTFPICDRPVPPAVAHGYAVLNAADPGTSSDNAAAALRDFPPLTLLDAAIRRRKAFANAVGLGLSVEELTPATPRHARSLLPSFPWYLTMQLILK
jgi:hypothetical protein